MAMKYKRKDDDFYATQPRDVKKDYSDLVASSISQARELLAKGLLRDGVELLFGAEKQTRQGLDVGSTQSLAVAIVNLVHDAGDWKLLNEVLMGISKRRSQMKQVIVAIIQEGMKFIPNCPSLPQRIEYLETLRDISEGKIHTELERAELTRMLAKIHEDAGNIIEAAELMQDLQIESYAKMPKHEKIEYILEQARLCLNRNDNVRGIIMYKKILPKSLRDMDGDADSKGKMEALNLRWCEMGERIWNMEGDYVQLSKVYLHLYDTPGISEAVWANACVNAIVFTVLSPYSSESMAQLHLLLQDPRLERIQPTRPFVKLFTVHELMRWPKVEESYGSFLLSYSAFADPSTKQTRWLLLRDRVMQHNIRTIARYYSSITLVRTGQLLDTQPLECERYIADMVVDGQLSCKIDRPAGVVRFTKHVSPAETLNEWSEDISLLLSKMQRVGHLISRERMAAAVKSNGRQ
jgi:26S proteasome regulatory subunit N5